MTEMIDCKTPGKKKKSKGKGRGLAFGKGKGPMGVPGKKKKTFEQEENEMEAVAERGVMKALEEIDDGAIELWAGFFEEGNGHEVVNLLEGEMKVEKKMTKEEYDEICEQGWIPAKLIEKYIGFKKLKKKLTGKKGVRDPGGLAAAIGKAKYGKEKFKKAAAKGKKMKGKKATFPGYKGIKFGKRKKRARKAA